MSLLDLENEREQLEIQLEMVRRYLGNSLYQIYRMKSRIEEINKELGGVKKED
jgi:capsule polysaccharide export protein KpsE/RkpR